MDAIAPDSHGGVGGPEEGEGASPFLTLDGFTGTLDHLLALARGQKIDLADISLAAVVDQLTATLRQAPATTPLGQKADWVLMAAWLVQLRARLLVSTDAPVQHEAQEEVCQLRGRLVALQETQALAVWLERRPQLGQDVFARGRPEIFGVSVEAGQAVDVIEFLWASLALFDDGASEPDTATTYRPIQLDLYAVVDARARILHRLAETPDGASLEQLLPEASEPVVYPSHRVVRRRSAWASTFLAALELAKQGDVVMRQRDPAFTPIQVTSTSVEATA
jgi:segregation and condensation protein A